MGAFIALQPNGKYCRFSTITDCPTHWDMTREEYIKLCVEKAKAEAEDVLANYVLPFEKVIEEFRPRNMTKKEFKKFLHDVER